MRISTDGFIHVRDNRRVRTPGFFEAEMDPMPQADALAFLLSHSFPGHRRIVRPMTQRERRKLRRASWADSVNDRMNLLDLVWRGITKAVPPPRNHQEPELVQVVRIDDEWAFPIYLDGGETRVLPIGGVPLGELQDHLGTPILDMREEKVSA